MRTQKRYFYLYYIIMVLLLISGCAGISGIAQNQGMGTEIIESARDNKIDFIWPLKGRVISFFGSQKGEVLNKGIDIRSHKGALILAAADGEIAFCADNLQGYGKVMIIAHSRGFSSVYAHNQQTLARLHQIVKKGEAIAACGDSGRAKFPQLHFEIRKDHIPQNPLDYLPR